MAQTVYDPPVATYIPIQTITLGASASSVTFAGIPQTYQDLVLIWTGAYPNSGGSLRVRLNGDSGNNYSNVEAWSRGSSFGSGQGTSQNGMFVGYTDSNIGQGQISVDFMDYSQTDKHTTSLVRYDKPSQQLSMIANRWANNAAVTSMTMLIDSSTLAVGSTFSLYGIEA
jgi:hypothetical protein